jgi:hypothetical protein
MPLEIMKQRMQVQGTEKSWASAAAKGSISQAHRCQFCPYVFGTNIMCTRPIFFRQGVHDLEMVIM